MKNDRNESNAFCAARRSLYLCLRLRTFALMSAGVCRAREPKKKNIKANDDARSRYKFINLLVFFFSPRLDFRFLSFFYSMLDSDSIEIDATHRTKSVQHELLSLNFSISNDSNVTSISISLLGALGA